ncbi:Bifunctional arginine demethylase and lysyl-hydroxylase psr-1 [Papilio xuthus]|uniref:Bifunctional arginine demethylase and lysyl-hydroxylase psr-1 n=1 Tax=Papilio xuthus TaxID=66420 RepID=A0A194QIR0_PAPXU|nr:Bifunctional arginine demethylase and lysyl-hydroxylase psr-1 [Papilio xuthus]
MSSSRPKLCDKKIKLAEIKLLKILYKIDNLKLKVPSTSLTLFRPPEDCSMCDSVAHVVRLANLTPEEFERRYAYSPTPVIVTDATRHWRAIKEFNFDFFADFYRNGKMGNKINECFFFAYKSGLRSLGEVLSMDAARANLSGEPWYVGWSTCYDEESRRLRQYYDRPYFLPRTSESDTIDWIFMGGPGQGAHMHVDSVRRVSWQAQVRGHKRWQLAPPPECLYTCRALALTVHPGEICLQYYDRPYFLPRTAESDSIDWIFMGGPGQGAHMHVDSVRRVSWQAQVRGHKRWQLAPPPECLYTCRALALTVHPGEILVVDTNRWYHMTRVLPGDLSITIGAEYD